MSTQYPNISPKHWLLLSVTLMAIAFVYIYRIGDKALDLDERFSMNIATGMGGPTVEYTQFGQFIANPIPGATFSSDQYQDRYKLSNMVSTAMNDNGQGLPYFFLLHTWLKLFGISTLHARLLSALLLLVGLALLYKLMLRCGIGVTMSLIGVVLFGCNGVVMGLAQYVRFYSLGILLTVMSCHLVWGMREKQKSKATAGILGLLWGLMLLNQFFAVFIIAAQGIYLLVGYGNKKPLNIIPIAVGLLLPVGIWLLPLHGWESLRNIYTLQRSEHLAIYSLSAVATPLGVFVGLLSSFAGAVGQPVNILGSKSSVFLQVFVGLPALLLIGMMAFRRQVLQPDWIKLCLLVLFIYVAVSVAHSSFTGYTLLFQGRYWVFAYVFSYLLLGWTLVNALRSDKGLKWVAFFVLFISCSRMFYTSASAVSGLALGAHARLSPVYIQPNEDYEGVAATLVKTAHPGDTVSYKTWRVAQSVNWFLTKHPEVTQRVDTMQPFLIMIAHGPLQNEVAIGRGRTRNARPMWQ